MSKKTSNPAAGPALSPLTPRFDPENHQIYVDALEGALTGPDAKLIHNIALTGAYGAGKSSVLQAVVSQHADQVVQISLSTLGNGDPTPPSKEADKANTPTNRIQKEIVKQLLYQTIPSRVPGSRFKRLGRLPKLRTGGLSILIGLVLALVAFVSGFTAKLMPLLTPLTLAPLQSNAGVWVVASLAVYLVFALLHNRLAIEKLSAGSATISLSPRSETFFDEYLDEIVYFFDITGKTIVILEDIDRFDEPNIFETLRALNTLLNSAAQLKGRNIRFIYAMKDSIFDELSNKEAAARPSDSTEVPEAVDPVANHVARANRTKFFDLVIPVVPFVTHLNARDLMARTMKTTQPPVDPAVIDLTARHLPDMRLIIETRNEYLIFSKVVLDESPDGLRLNPSSLFAMMLYKTTHLSDFEKIRVGTSSLDALYAKRGELIARNAADLNRRASAVRQTMRFDSRGDEMGKTLGASLVKYAKRLADHVYGTNNYPLTFVYDGTAYSEEQVREAAFWRSYAAKPAPIDAQRYPNFRWTLSDAELREYVGSVLPGPEWTEDRRRLLTDELAKLTQDRESLAHATMAQLYADDRYRVDFEGEDITFAELAERLIPSPLARQLLQAGFIDDNFTLYTSRYYGERRSAQASNYLIHNIDLGIADPRALLSADDVATIIHERGDDVLGERAMYNISVLNYLLGREDARVDRLVKNLLKGGQAEVDFLRTYFAEGTELHKLTRLLAPWIKVLAFLTSDLNLDESVRVSLVNTALEEIAAGKAYQVTEELTALLEANYRTMAAFVEKGSTGRARAITEVLERAGVTIPDLTPVAPTVRDAVVSAHLYSVTRSNLVAAAPDAPGLSLDQLREADGAVYEHVLENAEDYLAALTVDEPTVASPAAFVQVVKDTLARAPRALGAVVSRAAIGCSVVDIKEVEDPAWEPLAAARRFPASFSNVHAYVAKHGIDEALGALLTEAGAITVSDADSSTEREGLAPVLLKAAGTIPDPEVRVGLVESLKLSTYLTTDEVTPEEGPLVSRLIAREVIEDDATAFALVRTLSWPTRELVIEASEGFITYMSSTQIASSDVARLLASQRVPDRVKEQLVVRSSEFAATGDRAALTAIAERARSTGTVVSLPELARMAQAKVTATLVTDLLEPHLNAAALTDLAPVLTALGDPYTKLTTASGKHPTLPDTPAGRRLLARLEELGIVKSTTLRGSDLTAHLRRS